MSGVGSYLRKDTKRDREKEVSGNKRGWDSMLLEECYQERVERKKSDSE